jgi:hypothetical protein
MDLPPQEKIGKAVKVLRSKNFPDFDLIPSKRSSGGKLKYFPFNHFGIQRSSADLFRHNPRASQQ